MIEEIGEINYPARIREKYIEGFLEHFKKYNIQKPIKVVIDYAYRINNVVLPTLLGKLGIDAVVLNAHVMSRPKINRDKLIKQLSEVVVALNADFGAVIDNDGERLILVDNDGQVVGNNKLLALMTKLIVEENPGGSVVVPVNYPNVIDQIVTPHNSKAIMTKASNRSIMETAKSENAIFAGRNNGQFIFPYFHCGFDAMFSIAMLASLVSKKGLSISELISDIPQMNYMTDTIPCMADQKGTVIRNLVEKTRGLQVDLLDGIKIHDGDGWVLILPDPSEPLINMFADGSDADSVSKLLNKYKNLTQDIISKAI